MIGLISAVPEELHHVERMFARAGTERVGGFDFQVGTLDGHDAVLVEAGIGKVNAAVVGTLLATRFGCRGLVFSGVAGGLDPALGIGDVVVATRLVQHDYGVLTDGAITVYQPGVPPLPGFDPSHGYAMAPELAARVRAALEGVTLPPVDAAATGGAARLPVIRFGTVVTGDTFLNCAATRDRLHASFGALAVEMEGAALAQVAERFGVPLVVVRSLSDLAGAESHMDFPAFVRGVAGSAADLARRVVGVLAA